MNIRTLTLSGIGMLAICASAAMADSMPEGAQPTDPEKIIDLYNGKTSNWKSGGFAYWGPGGKLQATGPNGNAYGVGKWYVTTASKLCQEATYYWMESGSRKSEAGKWCWKFATGPDGTIWENYLPEDTGWYRHRTDKQVRGNPHRRELQALKRKVGL
uniref:DUF995 domain-containing protein n=1 Tax=Roseovarius indicus TaxID=540747 RepID=UPI003B520612